MQQKIQTAASALIGMPLWDAGRASDLAWFIFGERRSVRDYQGNSREIGEFSLHVQCAWRLLQRDRTIVGNRDLYYPAGWGMDSPEVPAGFKWDVQGANRLDERLKMFFQADRRGLIASRLDSPALCKSSFVTKPYWKYFPTIHSTVNIGACFDLIVMNIILW